MQSSPAVVLLAAGNSSRYGRAKLLENYGGAPLVRRAAETALSVTDSLCVVTGAYAADIRQALADLDCEILHNAHWQDGMGSSIATAFTQLLSADAPDAAIVLPADLPLIGTPQLQRLLDVHRAHPQQLLVSDFGVAQGPPCLFPRRCFHELAQMGGTQGARAILEKYTGEIQRVPMPEAATDIDTPEDYARLVKP